MKKVIFSSLLLIIIFISSYMIVGLWGLFEIKKNFQYLFNNKSSFLFHKEYSDKIHHLRDVNRWGKNQNEYLFSIIYKSENKNKTLLIQGDSWVESISEINSSELLLKKFGIENNFNIYNAGITSYSPSLMHRQYEILKQDFKIKPDILVIYIDQTDIGDEFCRYKKNKVYSNSGKLISIKREKFTRATYDYSKLYMYSELNFENNLMKVLKFPYKKTSYFLKRNTYQIKNIIKNGYKNRNVSKCGFQEIMKELVSYNPDAEINFKKALVEYFEYLNFEKELEGIFIVSFPHRKHLEKSYVVNVSNYIDDVIKDHPDKRLKHINMSKLNFNQSELEDIYKKNDLASHLNDKNHTKIFMKNILSNLKKKYN